MRCNKYFIGLVIVTAAFSAGCVKDYSGDLSTISYRAESNQQQIQKLHEKIDRIFQLEKEKERRANREKALDQVAMEIAKPRAFVIAMKNLNNELELNERRRELSKNQRDIDANIDAMRGNARVSSPLRSAALDIASHKSIYREQVILQYRIIRPLLTGFHITGTDPFSEHPTLDSDNERDWDNQQEVIESNIERLKDEYDLAQHALRSFIIPNARQFYRDHNFIPVVSEFLPKFELEQDLFHTSTDLRDIFVYDHSPAHNAIAMAAKGPGVNWINNSKKL